MAKPTVSAKAKTFVPRKKNILVISKPDGTRVNNTVPESSNATAQRPEPPATIEYAAISSSQPATEKTR